VEAHESRLLAVNCCDSDSVQLYDANIRINVTDMKENACILETDYGAKEIQLFFNKKVNLVLFNGTPVAFSASKEGREIYFDTDKAGVLEISMEGE